MAKDKDPHAVAMAKKRAEKLSAERRAEIASGAAKSRWKRKKRKKKEARSPTR